MIHMFDALVALIEAMTIDLLKYLFYLHLHWNGIKVFLLLVLDSEWIWKLFAREQTLHPSFSRMEFLWILTDWMKTSVNIPGGTHQKLMTRFSNFFYDIKFGRLAFFLFRFTRIKTWKSYVKWLHPWQHSTAINSSIQCNISSFRTNSGFGT